MLFTHLLTRAPSIAYAVLAVGLLVLAGLLYRESAECDRQAARIDTLYGQAKALEQAAASSKHRADSLSSRISALALHPIHSGHIAWLRGRGLEEPIADLIRDLQSHPEIIPHRGTHGERMGFYDMNRIRVLSDSWVYAPFDDGHIVGEGVFEYRVTKGGSISWRVLDSRIE
jgi:hypothetical protein